MKIHLSELPAPPPGKSGWPWDEASPSMTERMPDGAAWPRVSIVTPSFNQGQFIEETIRSVLLQGYPNLEYIAIDGGSTDGSVEIIKKYEPWLAYWVSEPDAGQSEAVNKGWGRARGGVLAYLNSDDSYKPGAIRTAVEALWANPKAGMVYGDSDVVDAESRVVSRIESQPLDLKGILSMERFIPQETAFIRRSALDEIGHLNPGLHYAMDYDLWVRIARRFELHYLPKTLANFRISPVSKTVSQSDQWLPEGAAILESAFAEVDFGDEQEHVKALAHGRLYWFRGISNYAQGNVELGKQYCLKALEQPHWIEEDIGRLVNPLVHAEKSVAEAEREALIRRVLMDLPVNVMESYNLEDLVWREYYASEVFREHERGRRMGTVRAFFNMAFRTPSALRNIGTVSILLESLLGKRPADGLRRLTGRIRAVLSPRKSQDASG